MSKRVFVLNNNQVELLLCALCNYQYEWCVPGSKRFKYVDNFINNYFKAEDYKLSHFNKCCL